MNQSVIASRISRKSTWVCASAAFAIIVPMTQVAQAEELKGPAAVVYGNAKPLAAASGAETSPLHYPEFRIVNSDRRAGVTTCPDQPNS